MKKEFDIIEYTKKCIKKYDEGFFFCSKDDLLDNLFKALFECSSWQMRCDGVAVINNLIKNLF